MAARASRMSRELKELESRPPEGVSAWPIGGSLFVLGAKVQGPPGTVYADGWFELSIEVPDM
jgi:ubiquitin-protein ligase